jgi:hypothetical protein
MALKLSCFLSDTKIKATQSLSGWFHEAARELSPLQLTTLWSMSGKTTVITGDNVRGQKAACPPFRDSY